MILTIGEIIGETDRRRVRDIADGLSWRDGKISAGAAARAAKVNEQADLGSVAGRKLIDIVMTRLGENAVLRAAARPRAFSNLLLSRTVEGGGYGPHTDNAIMRKGADRLRTDLSFTLFLSDPEDYDGGALRVHHAGHVQEVKPAAGDLVLYPSTSVHEVTPVRRGVRLACVGWIESQIAEQDRRELLFDLENLRASLRESGGANAAELITLDKSIANLLRMWARP